MKGAGSILVFVAAFVVVTVILIFMNSKFNNIFKFDFSAPHAISINKNDSSKVKKDSSAAKQDEGTAADINLPGVSTEEIKKPEENKDSVKKEIANVETNSVNEKVKKELENKKNSEKKIEPKNTKVDVKTNKEVKVAQVQKPPVKNVTSNKSTNTNKNTSAKIDSSYIKWTKNTAAIYETMDAKKAAKIIENYSDNIARDIIYAMKKKKAAEILAELSPQVASKITKAK